MYKTKLIAITGVLLILTGCASIIMPYHEDSLCKKGVAGGYCDSLSEIDEYVDQKYFNKAKKRRE